MATINYKVSWHVDDTGNKYYYLDDGQPFDRKTSVYHREDGPAIENFAGSKFWYYLGKAHRKDGPAIEYPNGYCRWFYHGKVIPCSSNEEFLRLIRLMPLM